MIQVLFRNGGKKVIQALKRIMMFMSKYDYKVTNFREFVGVGRRWIAKSVEFPQCFPSIRKELVGEGFSEDQRVPKFSDLYELTEEVLPTTAGSS